MRKYVVVFYFVAVAQTVTAYSQMEELSVVESLVRMIMSSPGWEDNVKLDTVGREEILPFQTYDDLFSVDIPTNQVGWSWSPHERKEAFENFIAMIPELSTNGLYRAIGTHGGVALSFCREHGVSNVLHSAMRILTSPHSVAQRSALGVFEEFAVPTDEVSAMAAQILTNKTAETEHSRKYFLGAYARVLQKHKDNCRLSCLTNGISIAISGVYGWAGAVSLDKLLIDVFPEYGTSSNRLAVASSALAADYPNELFWDWRTPIQEYFAPITNQLLNISQPLPEVEALRGLGASHELNGRGP